MSVNQKGSSQLILVAVIVVLLIGGALYLNSNKNNLVQDNVQQPSQENITESSNSLKTYKNKELGYEFNYETDSNLKDSKSYVRLSTVLLDEKVKDESGNEKMTGTSNYFNLEVFKQRECLVKASDLKDSKVSKITVFGMEADLIEGYAAYDNYRRSFCINQGGNTYWFLNEFSLKNSENVRNQSKRLFDQVVSSFKFE